MYLPKIIGLFFAFIGIAPTSYGYAQERQQQKLDCKPVWTLPAAAETFYIMNDNDGDRWVRIKTTRGVLILGFITKNQQFCMVTEGKANPDT